MQIDNHMLNEIVRRNQIVKRTADAAMRGRLTASHLAADVHALAGLLDQLGNMGRSQVSTEGQQEIKTPRLVARWPMDENSGDSVRDVVNGHDGKFLGAGPKWVRAKSGSGLEFDGTPGVAVNVPKSRRIKLASSLTLSAWVKLSDLSGERQNFVSYADSYVLFYEGKFGAVIEQNQADNTWFPCLARTDVVPNKWYFLAMTFDSRSLSIYVNGKLENRVDAKSGEIPYKKIPFWFGGAPERKSWWLKGTLDEVHIWDAALTPEEIMVIYKVATTADN